MTSASRRASRRWRSAPSSASPTATTSALLRQEVDAVVRAGAARVRLKVEPGWVVEPVRAVRADHPDLVLQVDANGSFSTGDDDVARAQPSGRVRRAVHRAAAAAGRPRRPRAAGPPAAGPDLPRRVALLAPSGHRRAAQRLVRHGLPEAGPPRRPAGHPGRPRRLRRRRACRPSSAASSRPGSGARPTWPWPPA